MNIEKKRVKKVSSGHRKAVDQLESLSGSQERPLALLPLKNVVILPKSVIPIVVGRASSIKAVEFALRTDKMIFITAQKISSVEVPQMADLYEYGTRSTILQVMRMPNGALKILAEGVCRARVVSSVHQDGFLHVQCADVETANCQLDSEIEAMWRQLKSAYYAYAKINDKAPSDLPLTVKKAQDIDYLIDTVAVHVNNLSFEDRQRLIETADMLKRMVLLTQAITKEIEILNTEKRIRGRVQTQVEKNQREYYLTEQIKAIQKELGREDHSIEVASIRSTIKKLGLSAEAHEKIEKELKRLEQMQPMSSEAVVSRNYIDWITSLPWKDLSKDSVSLVQAEQMLHKNHAGLKKAKERILEFVAAKKFSKNLERSPIICLVGPPGVGKTSLAQSIAKSLGREFVRISLGGVKDEAEIRGHRRTYIGALPGKIIQAIRKSKKLNPIILLDEIDKMSRDFHGDPSSALLEVLDPEQNRSFMDHFLDVEFDLSKVMFIATANLMDAIPYPLFDRMEIISLSGYTDEEKIDIAREFLIPKNLKEYDLKSRQFMLPKEQLVEIVAHYTKEAGVRQLDRLIAKLMRKAIQLLLKDVTLKQVVVTEALLKEWLGNQIFKKTVLNETAKRIGLVTGLAWTEVGGDVLEIEATVIPGKGSMTLTGQLGDVMQESAHAALSYVRAHAKDFGLADSFYTSKDLHLHIPEGATPKDGPSAGIAMCTAIISALTHNATKTGFAMTGEITLQGRVLAVGGIKEKLIAAHQHGFKKVFLPEENRDDVQEVFKESNLDGLEIIYVKVMDDVVNNVFNEPFSKSSSKKKAVLPKKSRKTKKS